MKISSRRPGHEAGGPPYHEIKSGAKVSDIYPPVPVASGIDAKENALEKVNYWMFPGLAKKWKSFPVKTVSDLHFSNGIVYNKDLIPKDKRPRTMRLVDPKLSSLGRKHRIPAHIAWLAELSLVWGRESEGLHPQTRGDQRWSLPTAKKSGS